MVQTAQRSSRMLPPATAITSFGVPLFGALSPSAFRSCADRFRVSTTSGGH